MSVPSDVEMQRAASLALLPNVAGVRMFFELSQEMKQVGQGCSVLAWLGRMPCPGPCPGPCPDPCPGSRLAAKACRRLNLLRFVARSRVVVLDDVSLRRGRFREARPLMFV